MMGIVSVPIIKKAFDRDWHTGGDQVQYQPKQPQCFHNMQISWWYDDNNTSLWRCPLKQFWKMFWSDFRALNYGCHLSFHLSAIFTQVLNTGAGHLATSIKCQNGFFWVSILVLWNSHELNPGTHAALGVGWRLSGIINFCTPGSASCRLSKWLP